MGERIYIPMRGIGTRDSTQGQRRLMTVATQAAPKPLSMLTTLTLEAQLFNMPRSAATPPKLAP